MAANGGNCVARGSDRASSHCVSPPGEAGIDVYGRVTGFFGSLYREHSVPKTDNVLIISHGLTMRLFLMRWYRWTVEMFENTQNPPNCGLVIMERDANAKLRLVDDAGILGDQMDAHDDFVVESHGHKSPGF